MIRVLRHPSPFLRSFLLFQCRNCTGKSTSSSDAEKAAAPLDMVGINFKEIVEPAVREPQTIKHLNLEKNLKKAQKKGSMIRSMYVSTFDPDFLQYPEILKSRHQYKELMKQSSSINKYFKDLVMRDPGRQISTFGFQNLWFLTKTEMVNIFESIGQSMAHQIIDQKGSTEDREESILHNTSSLTTTTTHPILEAANVKHILRLLFNNITIACIDSSPNVDMKNKMYKEMNENPDLKIAWSWSESYHMKPGMSECEDFKSHIQMTVDKKYLLINADKDGILEDDYDYYLIFARTRDYASNKRPEYLLQQDVPYDGLISVLVPKSLIATIDPYCENGINYIRIKVQDVILPISSYQVLDPEVDGVQANNYKGLIKLCMSALMIGQMKASMNHLNEYLVQNKAPLLSCDAIAKSTTSMISDLYVAESSLYYSTAMFDQLNQELYPEIHLEAGLTSILTHEAAESFYGNVREILGPSGKLAPVIDLNVILRNMIETEDYTRIKIVLDGLDFLLESKGKWIGKFAVSPNIRERNLMELEPNFLTKIRRSLLRDPSEEFKSFWDLQGFLHPTFEFEARTMERVIKILGYCAEIFITANSKPGKKGRIAKERMYDIYLLSNITLTAFKLVCILSRASRSFAETLRNADMDVEMVKLIVDQVDYRILDMMEEMETAVPGKRSHRIVANIAEYRRTGQAYYITDPLDSITKDARTFDPWDFGPPLDPQKDLTEKKE